MQREVCKNARQDSKDFRNDYISTHSYVLEPLNMEVIQSLPFTKQRQKCIREFYIANRSMDTQKAKAVERTEDKGLLAGICSKTCKEVSTVDAPKCKEFLSINLKPMASFSDVEVTRLCEHQPEFGRKTPCKSELESAENADRARNGIFSTAVGKEGKYYSKNVHATDMQCSTISVKRNVPDFDFRHLSSAVSDASLANSMDFDKQEARKRTVVFSGTSDNTKIGLKDSQMPRITTGSNETELQNYAQAVGCLGENIHHSSFNGGAAQKKTFSQQEKKGTLSRRTVSGRELEKVRHEIRDSINSEISCLEKELDALWLKVP